MAVEFHDLLTGRGVRARKGRTIPSSTGRPPASTKRQTTAAGSPAPAGAKERGPGRPRPRRGVAPRAGRSPAPKRPGRRRRDDHVTRTATVADQGAHAPGLSPPCRRPSASTRAEVGEPVQEHLLDDRQDVLDEPVEDEPCRHVLEEEAHEERHQVHDAPHGGVARGRRHLLLDPHRERHQDRGDVVRVLHREVGDPEHERRVPELDRVGEEL